MMPLHIPPCSVEAGVMVPYGCRRRQLPPKLKRSQRVLPQRFQSPKQRRPSTVEYRLAWWQSVASQVLQYCSGKLSVVACMTSFDSFRIDAALPENNLVVMLTDVKPRWTRCRMLFVQSRVLQQAAATPQAETKPKTAPAAVPKPEAKKAAC